MTWAAENFAVGLQLRRLFLPYGCWRHEGTAVTEITTARTIRTTVLSTQEQLMPARTGYSPAIIDDFDGADAAQTSADKYNRYHRTADQALVDEAQRTSDTRLGLVGTVLDIGLTTSDVLHGEDIGEAGMKFVGRNTGSALGAFVLGAGMGMTFGPGGAMVGGALGLLFGGIGGEKLVTQMMGE